MDDLNRTLIARLENWVTEMRRSAKSMQDVGLNDVAAGNLNVAQDIEAALRLIYSLTRAEAQPASPGEVEAIARVIDMRGGVEGWQDIATAPRDGAKVDLLYSDDIGIFRDARWRDDLGWSRPFLTSDGDLFYTTRPNASPTHWRPLPPASARLREGGGVDGAR